MYLSASLLNFQNEHDDNADTVRSLSLKRSDSEEYRHTCKHCCQDTCTSENGSFKAAITSVKVKNPTSRASLYP